MSNKLLDWFRGLGQRPATMAETKAALRLLWPSNWDQQKFSWQIGNFEAYAGDGFTLNSLIYAAVMYKVRAQQSSPMRARVGDMEHSDPAPWGHPLAALLRRPNPFQSWYEFHGLNTTYLNICGNVFIYLLRRSRNELPSMMQTLRPDHVMMVPDSRVGIKGYVWVPSGCAIDAGVPILPEDMIHVKLPNPLDPLDGLGFGLSPLAACAGPGDTDNMVTKFLRMFFKNAAIPAGLLKYDMPLQQEDMARARRIWQERYGGVNNWSDVAVLDQGASFERVGMSFDEMGFEVLDERNESRILGPLGVPPILIGTRLGLMRSTYSNFETAKKLFWEDTFKPEQQLYEVEFQNSLTVDGAFPAFDFSEVPALQQDMPALVAAAYQLWSMAVPANIAFTQVGLRNMPEVVGGDIGYLPATLVPVGPEGPIKPEPPPMLPPVLALPAIEPVTQEPTPEEQIEGKALETKSLWPQRKAVLWKAVDRTARSWEPAFARTARKEFEADKRSLLAAVTAGKQKALALKATVDWEQVGAEWEQILSDAGDRWREAFIPQINGVINDQGEHLALTFGFEFDTRNMAGEEWFQKYMLKFAQPINQTTSDGVHQLIALAMRDGWSVPTMQKHMTTLFQQYMKGDVPPEEMQWYEDRLPAYRTEMIARTESMRASNAGSSELYREWGVTKQEWLSTKDDRTRSYDNGDEFDHVEADGQIVGMDSPFDVSGESLMYPGDPSGSPGNTINCRCTLLPVMDEAKGGATSGNWGHAGRPGEVGGSASGGGGSQSPQSRGDAERIRTQRVSRTSEARVASLAAGSTAGQRLFQEHLTALQNATNATDWAREVAAIDVASPVSREIIANRSRMNVLKARAKAMDPMSIEGLEIGRQIGILSDEQAALGNEKFRLTDPAFIKDTLMVNNPANDIRIGQHYNMSVSEAAQSKAYAERMQNFISEDTISATDAPVDVEHLSPGGRASYVPGLISITESDDFETFGHEYGHHIEQNNMAVQQAANDFLDRRTAGQTAQQYPGGQKGELVTPDKFYDEYVGKRYGASKNTEIVSMGIHAMLRDPRRFSAEDPEHFALTWDIMHGKIK